MRRKKSKFEQHLKAKRAKKRAQNLTRDATSPGPAVTPSLTNEQMKATQSKVYLAISKFARIDESDASDTYAAFVGCSATHDLLATNRPEARQIETDIWRKIKAPLAAADIEVGVQSALLTRTAGSAPEFDLKQLRRRIPQLFAKAGVSSFNGISLVDVPDPDDPAGFAIEVYLISLFYGRDIKRAISVWHAARPSKSPRTGTGITWLPSQQEELRAELKRVISPPLIGTRESGSAAETAGVRKWMKDPSLRAYVLFQAHSMLPMKYRLFARGDAEPILSSALAAAKSRGKQAAKGSLAVRQDGLVHFWFAENQRLGLNHTPPLWLLR